MITRRDTLLGAVALLWEVSAADAQTRNGTSAEQSRSATGPVFKHDLPNITMDDWEVTVNYVDYPPGRVGQPHHHAGFVLGIFTLSWGTTVRVTNVPEPSTLLLLGSGLIGFGIFRKRLAFN
jgi:hypothetical protein